MMTGKMNFDKAHACGCSFTEDGRTILPGRIRSIRGVSRRAREGPRRATWACLPLVRRGGQGGFGGHRRLLGLAGETSAETA